MPGGLRHFAINADDVPRARRFYETVFGWSFAPWGPPDFFSAETPTPGLRGAVQGRRSVGGQAMPGIEVTFGVEDIAAAVAAIEANGGKVLMAPFHIQGVGRLVWFQDTEGNIAGAMQYERPAP
ncbi:MAG: VOC family protein [Phenylobacterium sp.]|uniref:VOC family protein n=1 Tax=Phenylobacterium sp. TaxID=1871053 RepID=UPI001A631D80|nr:VOC family protein [Phenylobacterium sp.]MBL8770870.1 VOC family protein [Phenylobacterium sp.]